MLVTFSCPVHADITMFGDVAVDLLKMMGHSGTVPGAIRAEDVAPALARLRAALEAEEARMQDSDRTPDQADDDDDDEEEPPVPLYRRAGPLIELLEAASERSCDVMWDGKR